MRSTTSFVLCLALATASSMTAAARNATVFQFLEKPGPHAVGLKVVDQYDFSRTYRNLTDDLGKPYSGERARPLQTLIWYPAEKSVAKPMTVGDYIGLLATETSFDKPLPPADVQAKVAEITLAPATPMWAVRDAPMKPGHFPVVIYAPSFSNTSWENADLCEYLASYGYVVVAGPDMGANTREMTSDVVGVNAQARDISFLISYARSLPGADLSEIAVAGYSWGGISNLFAAARDNRIDALVALDGSMRYYPELVEKAGDVHPEEMTLPLLFFTQREITLEDAVKFHQTGPSVLNEWTHGDLVTAHMVGMTHGEFSSRGQRRRDVRNASQEAGPDDYSREEIIASYSWVARYTLEFLDAYLKHDAAAMTFLKKTPEENGVPRHLMSVDFRVAKGLPPSLASFREELGRQGFDHAAEVYSTVQKENHGFKLEESEINTWGYELMSQDHLPEAIALFKLSVQNFPDSGDSYDSLGEAYMKSGQKQLAIESYTKSLEKNPDNDNAKQKLKELKSAAPTAK